MRYYSKKKITAQFHNNCLYIMHKITLFSSRDTKADYPPFIQDEVSGSRDLCLVMSLHRMTKMINTSVSFLESKRPVFFLFFLFFFSTGKMFASLGWRLHLPLAACSDLESSIWLLQKRRSISASFFFGKYSK